MERGEAVAKLKQLIGADLHALAHEFGVTVTSRDGKVNKGWAGHVCERFLGIPLNTSQSPNFGSWELKSIPLKRKKDGRLAFKETMAITMIDAYQVARTPFEESHLLSKLRKAVCVAREVGRHYSDPTVICEVAQFDLSGEAYKIVRDDYESVRACLNDPARGFSYLTGKMGVFVQPRTKGAGHGSKTRAFYARPVFLAKVINLDSIDRETRR
jgi:DNA mismatch repair protein MutH